jgi:drug/metabolite transporter, DME family
MIGVLLAILSAATSAFSVVLVRKHSDQSNAFNISLIISLVGMIMLWPLALASTDFSLANLTSILLFGLSGILTPGFVRLVYYQGMKKLGAPVNASLFSVYPLYSSLLAVFFLSEILTPGNWIGIILVFLGGIFVEWSSREINIQGTKAKGRFLVYPILGGLALGAGSILRKYALNLFDAPILGVCVAYTFSLLPFVIFFFSSQLKKELSVKRDLRLFWAAGIGQAVTWILSFYAFSLEDVSVVTPLLSIEPVFVAIFAYLYLKKIEQLSRKLSISIILIMVGIILITAKLF